MMTPIRYSEVLIPTLTVTGEWQALFKREARPMLASVLLSYIRQRRWFGGKARRILSSAIRDVVTMPCATSVAFLIFFQIKYAEGKPETYLLPITLAPEQPAKPILNESPHSLIARLKLKDKDGDLDWVISDALFDQEFRQALLEAIAQQCHFKSRRGELIASPTKAFAKLRGSTPRPLSSALIGAEQTNTSVVYENKLVLKVFRRLPEGTSLEVETGRFLTEKKPFPNAPPLAGALEYQTPRQGEPITLGILHGYVPNQGDAWQYTLDSLARYFAQVRTYSGVSAPLPPTNSLLELSEASLPSVVAETISPYLASARLLGQRTAELHLTLASARADPNFTPEPFSTPYQQSLHRALEAFAIQVLQLLRQCLEELPDGVKTDAQKVLALEDNIIKCFQNITKRKLTGMRIHCHGDYHLGQVLYTGSDFFITDFEGEPDRHLGERRTKHSPLKDVAGMIRSFHYATYVARRGQTSPRTQPKDLPVLEQWAQTWFVWVSATFLKSYLEFVADSPVIPKTREEVKIMLETYLLDKAIYEVKYELNNRPDWVGIPLRGILWLLKAGEELAGTLTEAKEN